MMLTKTLMCFLHLVVAASCLPESALLAPWTPTPSSQCLTDAQAATLIAGLASCLSDSGGPAFNETSAATFTPDLHLYSDGYAFILGLPIESEPVITSLAQYQALASQIPSFGSIKTLGVIHDCSTITWRYAAYGVGNGKYRFGGINVLYVDWTGPDGGPLISVSYSEGNTGSFVIDLGGVCELPVMLR
jgi:hypothetical protein